MTNIQKSKLREILYNNCFDHLLVAGTANILFLVNSFEIAVVESSESCFLFVCLFV